jgi:ABC-2 type transport system permease protein
VRLFVHQLRAEQLVFWRSREAAVFVFVFPILLFVLLNAVYEGEADGAPVVNVLVAGLLGYGVANTAFAGLAILLVGRRENGILKRLRSTPLPPATYLAAAVTSILVVFALQSAALLTLAALVFGAEAPERPLSLVAALALGAASFAGLGFAAASLIRSAEGAAPVVNVIVLPMAFLTGGFGPARELPAFLDAVADVLPLRYFIDLVEAIFVDGEPVWSRPGAIAVLAAWGAAGIAVAARRFGWEPREG